MKIAFYAPLKPPNHPVPSGDRQMARLLCAALERAGHEVELVSEFRTWMSIPDPQAFADLKAQALHKADDYIETCNREQNPPTIFITYHLYHRAPDWIGPRVSRKLSIPYIVIEASRALKRKHGPWSQGFAAADEALQQAKKVLAIHQRDLNGLKPLIDPDRLETFPPFIDTASFTTATSLKRNDNDPVRLITAAMMREGDKKASYRLLAGALADLNDLPWHLTIAGDGPARNEILAWFPESRITHLGELSHLAMPKFLAGGDLFIWPAINEAYGLVLLEAQAAGTAILAGDAGGVREIVQDGSTGILTGERNCRQFTQSVRQLIESPATLEQMGQRAQTHCQTNHGIAAATRRLNRIINQVLP